MKYFVGDVVNHILRVASVFKTGPKLFKPVFEAVYIVDDPMESEALGKNNATKNMFGMGTSKIQICS